MGDFDESLAASTRTASPADPESLVQKIAAAVADLVWVSETDAPFDVVRWSDSFGESTQVPSQEQVLQQVQLPPETPVEMIDLETFLAPTAPQPWHSEAEQAIAVRFQTLGNLLHETLEEIQVFRCGEIELEIYIVGHTPKGHWIALHTSAVET